MNHEKILLKWLHDDPYRMTALRAASSLGLNDWCLAGGFVRNLVWDHLHGYERSTPLNDLDLIYFDSLAVEKELDEKLELLLTRQTLQPWSVKNQARMHVRNNDHPYQSTGHAMSYWVEIETAVGVQLESGCKLTLIAPFGLEPLFNNSITINPQRAKPVEFRSRIESKRWLELWPKLNIVDAV